LTELLTCPRCGKKVNPMRALCPFCRARVGYGKVLEEPLCPRCKVPLEPHKKEEMEVDLCPRCGGLWLDRGEFEVLTAESRVYREEKLTTEYSPPPLPGESPYLPCVRCGKLMPRKNFARISGVVIDECGRHGIWLDKGELEKIRQFILSGGLERAQFKELEATRQALKDLAGRVSDTAFTHKLIHFWNWKRWFFGR
jgi:Zn-finger nucleic acid-binding protein